MNQKIATERIEEALREVAILFVALAPLDVALGADAANAVAYGLIFVTLGLILFLAALINKGRRHGG